MHDNNNVNLINNLHPDLIQLILDHLPLKDAVKTSILLKKWKYKWTIISKISVKTENYMSPDEINLLTRFIANYFSSPENHIQKFLLHLYHLYHNKSLTNSFDPWLFFVSTKNIKELHIPSTIIALLLLSSNLYYCTKLVYLELNLCAIGNSPPPSSF